MMRFLVCSGIERAAGELFRAAETVPGVRPRWSAIVFRVTFVSRRRGGFFLGGCVIYQASEAPTKSSDNKLRSVAVLVPAKHVSNLNTGALRPRSRIVE